MLKRWSLCLLLMSPILTAESAEPRIEADKAPFYVGKSVMACGKLAAIKHTEDKHYLNLDKPYPNQSLTILLWESDYSGFIQRLGKLDNLMGKTFCGRGQIQEYQGNLEMTISNPLFLRLMKGD